MTGKYLLLALLATAAFAQDPVSITPYQLLDARSGQAVACSGCSIYTYAAGTNTPLATYTSSTLATPNTNPVLTNSAGYAVNGATITGIWVGSSCYKFVAKDSSAVTLFTQDNICNRGAVLKALLAASSGSSLIGYKYSAAATAETVQARLQQYVSFADFGAVGNGSTNDSTAVQAAITALGGTGVDLKFTKTASNIYVLSKIVTGGNIRIFCDEGVTLKMPTPFNGNTDFMFATSITQTVTSNMDLFQGCILDGNRVNESGGAGDGTANGIFLVGTSHAVIHGTFKNFWTDGIYIQGASANTIPSDHITIDSDVYVTSSRRNNVSVISGTNIFFNHPKLEDAGKTVGGQAGTLPKNNIDFEPNVSTDVIQNISGSVAALTAYGYNIMYAEQFANRTKANFNLTCDPCTGAQFGGVLVTDFGAGFNIGGVTINGHIGSDGAGGAGYAGVDCSLTVTCTITADIDESANAGTTGIYVYGPNASIQSGHVTGATYDYKIDAAATGCLMSTATISNHASPFNPAGIKCSAGTLTTFLPSLKFGGGSTGITYSTQSGTSYTIGNLVFVTMRIVLTSKGSDTGTATILGFPSTASADAVCSAQAVLGMANLNSEPVCYIANGGAGVVLQQLNSNTGGGTGSQGLVDTEFSNTTEMRISIVYTK